MFKESFVPILLVFTAIFTVIFYSNYIADIDADHITVIEIPSVTNEYTGSEESINDDEEFIQIEKNRINDPVLEQAYGLIRDKKWQKARNAYIDILKNYSSSQAYAELGYIYYRLKDYKKSELYLDEAISNEPVYVMAYYYRAKVRRQLDQVTGAEQDYKTYLKYLPRHFYANYNLGLFYLNQKDYHQAMKLFEIAVDLTAGDNKSRALYMLGRCYQKSGINNYKQAREAYQQSIRVYPGNIKPRLGLASLLPDTEQGLREAEEIYKQVIQLKENDAEAHFLLARVYSAQQRRREAMEEYVKAVEFNPAMVSARFNLGLIYMEDNKWSEAADQFRVITRSRKDHYRSYFNLGRANYRLKLYDEALVNYQAALDIKGGDYPQAAINIGLIYSAKQEFEKAISIYKDALKKNGSSAKLHYNLGLAYSKDGQHDRAFEEFNQAIKLRPKYAQAWYNLGVMLGRNDNHVAAIDAYRQAIEYKPDYLSALLNMAVSLTRLNNYKQAEQTYREVLELSPRYAAAWFNLGLVLMEQSLFENAEEVLLQAAGLDVENDRVYGLLARSIAKQNRHYDAISYYRKALDINPDNQAVRYEYIVSLRETEDYKKAFVEAEKALALFPDSKKIKQQLEMISDLVN